MANNRKKDKIITVFSVVSLFLCIVCVIWGYIASQDKAGYTVVFDVPEETAKIADMPVHYNREYILPTASKKGHKFISWQTQAGDVLLPGANDKNLTTIDNAEVVLMPIFEPIQYEIILDLDGGAAPLDSSIVTGKKVILDYTQSYTLPALVKAGYVGYNWICLENGKTYSATETLCEEFDIECAVTFKAVWTAVAYTIHYDCAGGAYGGQNQITVGRYWNDGASLIVPVREGYTFAGWLNQNNNFIYVLDGTEWSENLIQSTAENGATVSLKAQWTPNKYTVTLDTNGGSVSSGVRDVVFDGTYVFLPEPSRTGYKFEGWYLGDTKINSASKVTTASNHTLTAHWSPNQYTVSFDSAGGSSCSAITVTYGSTYGSLPTPSHANVSGSGGYTTYSFAGWYLNGAAVSNGTTVSTAGDHKLTASWNSSWVSTTDTCLAEGTMIHLADGSIKNVEELQLGDVVLVWNFETGTFDAQPIVLMQNHGNLTTTAIKLEFSDGTEIIISFEHAFFDIDLLQFVFIDENNARSFIGHRFQKLVTDEFGNCTYQEVELESVDVYELTTGWYNFATAGTLNHYANGILAGPANTEGLINIFDVDVALKYDASQKEQDIEVYGLYTYDEWRDYVTYEEFMAFNGQYFKVAIGKGLLTEEELMLLIHNFKYVW